MFSFLARLVTRHPRSVVAAWVILALLGFGVSLTNVTGQGGLFSRMDSVTSIAPHSEADRAYQIEQNEQLPSLIAVVRGVDPAQSGDLAVRLRELGDREGVASVADPFLEPQSPQSKAFLASDGRGFAVVYSLESDDAEVQRELRSAIHDEAGPADVSVTSSVLAVDSMIEQVQSDLVRGESIGLPVALVLMLLVFGGFIVALLPLAGAVSAIGITMGILWGLTFATTLDTFVLNVVTIIGLALSIDYGLLIVSRFREELGGSSHGFDSDDVERAVRGAVATAGRTVFFSAVTIALSISGLFAIDLSILKMVAAGGCIVVLLAVAAAVTLVPALIVLSGTRLAKPSMLARVPGFHAIISRTGDVSSDTGIFSSLASKVHRHPWSIMLAIGAILVTCAVPVRDLALRFNSNEYIPVDSEAYSAISDLDNHYPALATPEIVAFAPAEVNSQALGAELDAWAAQHEGLALVSATPVGDYTKFSLSADAADSVGREVTDAVMDLRDASADFSSLEDEYLLVGGPAALQHDIQQVLIDGAPAALAIIVLAVFVLLFLMTGSLIVPIKALIINALSVLSSIGMTTWIFEGGHLGVPQRDGLELMVMACAVAFGFGLAMDYEVFLLARIKEYWDAGLDNDSAVERALQRSGRIITSAAAIIIAVFIGFVSGDSLPIKEIGIVLAITVAVDATLVRMLLVPATMTVLGRWNWWAPAPLRKVYERFGISH